MATFNGTINLGTGVVSNTNIQASAGIGASKVQHENTICENFNFVASDTPTAKEVVSFICPASGTITEFSAGLWDTGTTTNVDFDLKVNNSSVLSAAVNVTNSVADRALTSGTISSGSVSAGDVITVDLAVTSSTGAQGPFARFTVVTNATGNDVS